MTETELAAEELGAADREITSIFVGGGTPSITSLELFADWLDKTKQYLTLGDNIEFSLECNPESTTRDNLDAFKALGVNRPVFGIQTFDTRLLKLLGRRHTPHQSHRAVYYANALGFSNFSVELIYGIPTQTSRILANDLDQLLDLDPPHISFFQLRCQPGTEIARRIAAKHLKLPDNELILAMYRGGCEKLNEAGYTRYEVSSFAKPGYECRHKLAYWEGGDLLGLGPSAHSFRDGKHFINTADLAEYIEQLSSGKLPRLDNSADVMQHMTETIKQGLRTTRGIKRSLFSDRFGVPLEARINREQYRLLVESGHLLPENDTLRLSDKGILLADEIARRLID
jgi:oxygen-independent coproporphyrinogen-3 oxidase